MNRYINTTKSFCFADTSFFFGDAYSGHCVYCFSWCVFRRIGLVLQHSRVCGRCRECVPCRDSTSYQQIFLRHPITLCLDWCKQSNEAVVVRGARCTDLSVFVPIFGPRTDMQILALKIPIIELAYRFLLF